MNSQSFVPPPVRAKRRKYSAAIATLVRALEFPLSPRALLDYRRAVNEVSVPTTEITTRHGIVRLVCPTHQFGKIADSTADWIDRFKPGSVLWDVGVSGVVPLYAAAAGHQVVAVPDSIETGAAIERSGALNKFGSVRIVALPSDDFVKLSLADVISVLDLPYPDHLFINATDAALIARAFKPVLEKLQSAVVILRPHDHNPALEVLTQAGFSERTICDSDQDDFRTALFEREP